MSRILQITIGLLFLFHGVVYSQLSRGGMPRSTPTLKLASMAMESMPAVNNAVLLWQNQQVMEAEGILKPLRFAHTFEVNYSPLTHGTWSRSTDGWWIWNFTIHSEGALSLNLLFDQFALSDDARLYLFTPGQAHILGAYTAENNQESGVFTASPLPGDEITLQYEIPEPPGDTAGFAITGVNHDFLGILKYVDERRPMGVLAEACNRDINCSLSGRWKEVRNSVCRIMVQGRDLCSGTLVNNTAKNQKPYVLTANHCISSPLKASGSLFLFNYESPYCGPLDGDVSHSLAGSKLKATLDSLDFALVELSTPPPPSFRPYYAGWSRNNQQTDTVVSIHHPQGDIKKIAIDHHTPVGATFLSSFLKGAFWRVQRWDEGTTEIGSSGGPLFNRNSQVTGTLSGGAASCSEPVNDYFARFDLAWSYKADSSKQLKHWLDPAKNNPLTLDGKQFNEGANLCGAFTNLMDGDAHDLLRITGTSGENKGYWSGTNSDGITEIGEIFSLPGKEIIRGISLGVGKIRSINAGSFISIRIYDLERQTATLITTADTISLRSLVPDAMNRIEFPTPVEPRDTFLISVNLENIRPGDTLAIYQSLRTTVKPNSFYFKKGFSWQDFRSMNPSQNSSSLAFELLACNIGGEGSDTLIEQTEPLVFFPNPVTTKLAIRSLGDLEKNQVSVFNMLGQQISCPVNQVSQQQVEVDLRGNRAGMYVIRIQNGQKFAHRKVMLVSGP